MTATRFSGAIGTEYDLFKLAVPHHDELQETVRTAVIEYVRARPTQSDFYVFEIGCGTGMTTRRILEADARIKVFASDNDRKMLKVCREELSEFGDRVTFLERSALETLCLMQCQMQRRLWIDIVASAFTIHNMESLIRIALISEIWGHLKRGGLFVNADKYANNDPNIHAQELAEQLERFNVFDTMGRLDMRERWTAHYLEDDAIRMSEGEFCETLSLQGFTNIKKVFRQGMEATILATKA